MKDYKNAKSSFIDWRLLQNDWSVLEIML